MSQISWCTKLSSGLSLCRLMFLVRLPDASFVFLISAGGYLTISWTIELIILVATLILLYLDIYIISFHRYSH